MALCIMWTNVFSNAGFIFIIVSPNKHLPQCFICEGGGLDNTMTCLLPPLPLSFFSTGTGRLSQGPNGGWGLRGQHGPSPWSRYRWWGMGDTWWPGLTAKMIATMTGWLCPLLMGMVEVKILLKFFVGEARGSHTTHLLPLNKTPRTVKMPVLLL